MEEIQRTSYWEGRHSFHGLFGYVTLSALRGLTNLGIFQTLLFRSFYEVIIRSPVQASHSVVSDSVTAACQASLSITNSRSLLKLTSFESVMSSNHLILCRPLLLLPSIFPSIRVFSNESVLWIRWPKYWSLSFSISLSNNIQSWFPLGLTPRDSQKSLPAPQFKSINQFFSPQTSSIFSISLAYQTLITRGILRALGALCQELGPKIKYFLLYHSDLTYTTVFTAALFTITRQGSKLNVHWQMTG